MSVRPSAWNNSAPIGRIFHEIWHLNIFRRSVRKIQFSLKSDKISGTLHEDQFKFLIISRSVLLRMRNVSDKSCRENQNTHFMFCNFFPKIIRPQMTIRRMRTACWIPTATNTHSEYVKLIAFPLQ